MVSLYICFMIKREILLKAVQLLKEFPAIALLGPRQVGKTTLAKAVKSPNKKPVVFLDLEKPADLKRLEDMELFFKQHRNYFVVVDEVQNKPELFSYLRPEIDELRIPGRFLLTGSAAPELVKGVSESLAGRIFYLEMFPLCLKEVSKAGITQQKHWLRGGFPGSLNAKSNAAAMRWRESFIRSYAERDLSFLFGVGITASTVKNFWSMLAGTHGSIYNSQNFARALGVSAPTVNKYLDLLEGAYLVRKLPAWFVNTEKRLVKSPKIYIRDSGLLHYFAQVERAEDLPGNIIVGASWEGYVIEEICRKLSSGVEAFYYRTHQGAEADLILVRGLKPVAIIEIKYSLSPSLSKGLYEVIRDLKTPPAFVIMPGGAPFKDKHNIKFVGLLEFLTKELQKI